MNRIQGFLVTPAGQLTAFACMQILVFGLFRAGWPRSGLFQDSFRVDYVDYDYASRIIAHQVPYRDFPVEYPPLALLVMVIPRLFTSDLAIYGHLFSAEMLVFEVFGLLLVGAIAARSEKSVARSCAIYTAGVAAIGPIITARFDIVAGVALVAALYFFVRSQAVVPYALLGIGAAVKIFPAVAVPILVFHQIKRRRYTEMLKGLSALGAVCLAVCIPFCLLAPGGFTGILTYHAERGLQIESTYASVLMVANRLGLVELQMRIGAGSQNVVSPLANALAEWSTLVTALCLLAVFAAYYLKTNHEDLPLKSSGGQSVNSLTAFFLLATLVVVLTSRVFSPQYLIWVLPLVAVWHSPHGNVPWLIFVAAALMTYFVYPQHYNELIIGRTSAIVVLLARNVALIALALLVARGCRASAETVASTEAVPRAS